MAAVLLLAGGTVAHASTTGGVFGPVVDEGHRSLQYRAAHDLDSHAFSHRLHAQSALTGSLMLRGVIQGRKTNDARSDLDLLQAELFWELSDDQSASKHGLRVDLTWRDDQQPSSVGLNWMSDWTTSSGWLLRAIAMSDIQFDSNRASGVGLQTRMHASKPINNRTRAGVELFSRYGRTDDLAGINDQSHLAGPIIDIRTDNGWSVFTGVLLGLTNGSPDAQIRLWLTRSL
ncbi:MAG: hypothetical protein NXH85_14695 [Pseudomonadaceae bacterium]|nr:hypothetical protein [Pseudomonadaceae bacterium]